MDENLRIRVCKRLKVENGAKLKGKKDGDGVREPTEVLILRLVGKERETNMKR